MRPNAAEPVRKRNRKAIGYGVAVLALLCSLSFSLLLRPFTYQTPYLLYYGAVLVAVLAGGFEAGLIATFLSAIFVHFFLLAPYDSFEPTVVKALQGTYFFITFSVICWLIERRKVRADSEIRSHVDDLKRAQAVAATGSWRLDVRRDELLWSDESYNIFGIELGTPLTYESFLSAVHPDDREMVDTRWQAALKGEPYDIEHRIVVDGDEKWVHETAELEFDEAGQLLGGFGAVQDITNRKKAELALQASESRMSTVLETLPVGVWLTNEKGLIVFANPAAQRIWAGVRYIPIDQHREFKGWWYGTQNRVAAEEWALSRALTKGETAVNELIEIECFDGQHKVIYNSGVPIRDKENHIIGALAINEDVTDRRKAEEALIRTEKLASAGRLAATIAHEIRNPLDTIRSVIYLLQTTHRLPQESSDMLNVIDEEGQRIEDIVRSTLTLQRDSRTATEVDVAKEVDLVVRRYRSKSIKSGIKIESSRWSTDTTIVGYPGEVRQVVTNLIANALDAVAPGGTIAVRVRRKDSAVRITVSDNGCGLPLSARAKLFEPFYTTKEETGTGLGLWVSKQLVEHCGGRIRVRSATRGSLQGTTFSAVFPSLVPASALEAVSAKGA